MKKIVELVKRYKVYILAGFLVVFFFRSCIKSTEIKKLDKKINNNEMVIDSLQNEIKVRQQKIDSLPETMRIEKINIHLEYDEWISSKDRGQQLMELHSIVKNNIKELQKK